MDVTEEYLATASEKINYSQKDRGVEASARRAPEDDLKGIFCVEEVSCDVVLTDSRVTWVPLGAGKIEKKKSKKKKLDTGPVKSDRSSGYLLLQDVLVVKIQRQKNVTRGPSQGVCQGVALFTYEKKDSNKLRERVILLGHPSEDICHTWANRIEQVLEGYVRRPKRIKMFLQPFAGLRVGRKVFREKICPMLLLAKTKSDVKEIYHKEQIKQEMVHLELDSYDCVIAMGGDGTVSEVVNGLLRRSQTEEGIDLKPGVNPAKACLPFGIVPIGTTNHIAHSVLGIDDPVTAMYHILYGNTTPLDICAVYSNDKFYQWAFNSQYGFAGNILDFSQRYRKLGSKRIDAAFLKALTKSKLKPYDCEIQFIPSPNAATSHPKDGTPCTTGCSICLGTTASSPRGSVYTDSLHEYDPLAVSGTSSTIIDLTKESPWHSTKGAYLSVCLFTVPALCEWAPMGLCKYTHLADGCADLVLVRNVERKEFLRYLKRHGGPKNQLDFPFVECYRVKEVKFRPRMGATWKHTDHDYDDLEYEVLRKSTQSTRLAPISEQMNVVDDLHDDHSDQDVEDVEDIPVDSDEDAESLGDGSVSTTRSRSKPSSANVSLDGSNVEVPRQASSAPSYRPSKYEVNMEKYRKKQREKEEKARIKETRKMTSVWNVDNELREQLDLDFRVHPHLLMVYGQGVSPDTEFEENRLGCIPRF